MDCLLVACFDQDALKITHLVYESCTRKDNLKNGNREPHLQPFFKKSSEIFSGTSGLGRYGTSSSWPAHLDHIAS